MNQLHRLIYMSRPREGLDDLGISSILASARRNNRVQGLTGFLACTDEAFLQVIEGPAAALSDCLHRLMHDERHSGLRLLAFHGIDARIFPDWGMGHASLDSAHQPLLLRYCGGGTIAPDAVTAAGALLLLQELSAEVMLAAPVFASVSAPEFDKGRTAPLSANSIRWPAA